MARTWCVKIKETTIYSRSLAQTILIRITKAGFVVKINFYAGIAISGRFESACGGYTCGRNFFLIMNTTPGTGGVQLSGGFLVWRKWVRGNPDFAAGRLLKLTFPHLSDQECAAWGRSKVSYRYLINLPRRHLCGLFSGCSLGRSYRLQAASILESLFYHRHPPRADARSQRDVRYIFTLIDG